MVTDALVIATLTFPLYWIYPVLEVVGGSLRGMGYALTSMIIILTNMGALRILLLAVFSEKYHTLRSLAAVYPITWAGAAICFVVAFVIVIARLMKKEKGN